MHVLCCRQSRGLCRCRSVLSSPSDALLRFLHGKCILLVLDNFEHVRADCSGTQRAAVRLQRCEGTGHQPRTIASAVGARGPDSTFATARPTRRTRREGTPSVCSRGTLLRARPSRPTRLRADARQRRRGCQDLCTAGWSPTCAGVSSRADQGSGSPRPAPSSWKHTLPRWRTGALDAAPRHRKACKRPSVGATTSCALPSGPCFVDWQSLPADGPWMPHRRCAAVTTPRRPSSRRHTSTSRRPVTRTVGGGPGSFALSHARDTAPVCSRATREQRRG